MSYGGGRDQCYASCPPSTVTIQPPPFTLTIPGPALYCPDQPLNIQQCNPCANVGGGGGMSIGGGYSGSGGPTEALVALGSGDDELWRRRWWGRPSYGGNPYWGGRPYYGGGRGPWRGRGPWVGSCLED